MGERALKVSKDPDVQYIRDAEEDINYKRGSCVKSGDSYLKTSCRGMETKTLVKSCAQRILPRIITVQSKLF
jgi:hypothetical protein